MHRRAVILVSLALIGATACSGSGGSSDAAPSLPPVSAPEVEPTTADGSAAPNDTADVAPTSDVDFCAAIAAIQSAEFELEETFGPEARALFDDVQSGAPPAIADDVTTVIATLDAIAEVGISADEDDPIAIDAAFEILLDPDFTEASENLEEYTSQACGIDLGDAGDADIDLDDLEG